MLLQFPVRVAAKVQIWVTGYRFGNHGLDQDVPGPLSSHIKVTFDGKKVVVFLQGKNPFQGEESFSQPTLQVCFDRQLITWLCH
jgi:hypothetical protein